MAGVNCEFKGPEASLTGFDMQVEHNDTPYFSIWAGKDLRFYGKDPDSSAARAHFEQILLVLHQSGSTQIYTCKFHDELNKRGKVDNTLPVIGSFNFRLFDGFGSANQGERWHQGTPAVQQQGAPANTVNSLMNKMQEKLLERMFNQLEAADQAAISGPGDEYDEKKQFILDIANSEVGSQLIGLISDYLPRPKYARMQQQQQPAHVAGIDDDQVLAFVARLRARDPEFDSNLAMLADLAEQSPFMYKKAIKKLKEIYE